VLVSSAVLMLLLPSASRSLRRATDPEREIAPGVCAWWQDESQFATDD